MKFKNLMRIEKAQIFSCMLIVLLSGVFTFKANAQNQKVQLSGTNLTLRAAFSQIEKQTQFSIDYDTNILKADQLIPSLLKEGTLNDVMQSLLQKSNCTFVITGSHIIISRAAPAVRISGIVKDSKGEVLIGANVVEKGTTNGTITDVDGNFSLQVKDHSNLEVSYIGYTSQIVPVKGKKTMVITLDANNKALDEVVVVGYGTQKKLNLTGAITQIDTEDLKDRPVTRMTQALQGLIPNLNVTFGSGKPGVSGTLNIRGNTSINGGAPLVLVDGVPGDLDRVNVNDVESVSVLKDASASAIYGARAAFGVILVTTKSAKNGKTKVTYTGNFGWIGRATNTDFITSGYWNAKINDDAMYNALGNTTTRYSEEDYAELKAREFDKTEHPDRPWVVVKKDASGKDLFRYYGNFDWYNYLYAKTRPRQEHSASISGATDRVRYLVTGAFSTETGVVNISPDKYKRYNLRAKIDTDITKWLRFSNNTHFFRSTYTWTGFANNFNKVTNNVNTDPIYNYHPIYSPKNPDGTLTGMSGVGPYTIGYGWHNLLEENKSKGENASSEFTTTFELTAKLFKGLSITANYTYNQDKSDYFYRYAKHQYSNRPGIMTDFTSANLKTDRLTETASGNINHIINAFGTYEISLKKHNIRAMAGFNQEYNAYKELDASGQEMLSETLNDLNFAVGEKLTSGGASEWALRGAFYRLNYDYAGKYLVETSGRYDGSSRFPKNSRFGFFPSFSLGWRISEESFMAPTRGILDNLKIRYSYGTLGNQNVNQYAYISTISTGQINYLVGNAKLNVANTPSTVAKSLTWERSISNNIGLDFGIFRNRLSFSGDFYIRDTKDMLTKGMTLPAVYGATEPKENAADLRTKGFELTLSWKDQFQLLGSPFTYSATAILSDYTSEITKFDNPTRNLGDYYVGQKLGEIWGYKYDGYFKTTEEAQAYAKVVNQDKINKRRMQSPTVQSKMLQAGDIKILDLDNSGEINTGANTVDNPGDRRIIGNTQPRYSYGLNLSVGWKGIDISALFQGIGKQNWYPHLESQMFWHVYARPYDSFIPSGFQNKIWSPENPNSYFPRLIGYTAQNSELSVANDMYMQDLAYCKLRNLTIGYSLPENILKKVRIEKLRIFASGENLFTWTKLDTDYMDPEQVMDDPTGRSYPMGKTYSFGIEITF